MHSSCSKFSDDSSWREISLAEVPEIKMVLEKSNWAMWKDCMIKSA